MNSKIQIDKILDDYLKKTGWRKRILKSKEKKLVESIMYENSSASKERLIKSHCWLVASFIRKYISERNFEYFNTDDVLSMIDAGEKGLQEAVENIELKSEKERFSDFASSCVEVEVMEALYKCLTVHDYSLKAEITQLEEELERLAKDEEDSP